MFKTLTAGLTAISLVLATAAPVQAERMDQDEVGKLLFGLLATAVVVGIVKNNIEDKAAPVTAPQRTEAPRQQPPAFFPRHQQPAAPRWRDEPDRSPRSSWQQAQNLLPQACLQRVGKGRRSITILGRGCIEDNYRDASSLPRACEVASMNRGYRAIGWDPQCLANRGYRISHR